MTRAAVEALAERAFDDRPDNPLATTQALAVMHQGDLVFERYAEPFDASSTFVSWSMAKSMTSALCGVLVDEGRLDIEAPAAVPEWQAADDPRRRITLRDLLGGRNAMEAALQERLFRPAGMTSAIPKFDDAGTFIGSSFVYATARDFLAFGELFRNRGMVGDRRVLSEAWVDLSVQEHSVDEESGQGYGLQWWLVRDRFGSYACNGYEGQRIEVVPPLGLTFVRLGRTDAAYADDLRSFYAEIVEVFA